MSNIYIDFNHVSFIIHFVYNFTLVYLHLFYESTLERLFREK